MKIQFHNQVDQDHFLFSEEKRKESYQKFEEIISSDEYGFFRIHDEQKHIEAVQQVYKKFKDKEFFVQIGIGGSALGPQMLLEALSESDRQFVFLDNTDSEDTAHKLSKIDLKKSLFYVVSKSGGTAETIANFVICVNELEKLGITQEQLKDYFVFATDPEKGELRKLSKEIGITTLNIPSNVGGRFSVLTPVGLLPALFAGINIEELFLGAKNCAQSIKDKNTDSELLRLAHELCYLKDQGVTDTVLMPYSSKLKSLSHWFVQLWGESLGKINKKGLETALTPIPAYGATDQHSQMQLFMEGENNKCLFLLEVENRDSDYSLSNSLAMESIKKLSPYGLNQLIQAQLNGTMKALKDRERNFIHIQIERNNAYELGQLILFFEALTACTGQLLELDPFDQPGVELGKKYAFEYLNSKAL